MIWGQTGTRDGATRLQLASVGWLWSRYPIDDLHDGDARGVDAQLSGLAKVFGVPHVTMHPPINPKNRAFCGISDDPDETLVLPPKEYFERDRDVVNAAEVMVACPKQNWENEDRRMRGGTWYTIYFTRKQHLPLAIVWPNGLIKYERWNLEQL
jgi:hypothetical protein